VKLTRSGDWQSSRLHRSALFHSLRSANVLKVVVTTTGLAAGSSDRVVVQTGRTF
jgi:hypothetical protein